MLSGRVATTFVAGLLISATLAYAQGLGSLKKIAVPPVPGLERYVRDQQALVVLGKSLFWDMQVGSDNRTACGTCHFHAGADHRAQNQLSNPNGPFRANHTLITDDFPFRVFADIANNRSHAVRDSAQRAGSAGVVRRRFIGLDGSEEKAEDVFDTSGFRLANLNLRQVTTRNTPSVINAALDVRTFRDGRASDVFTGRTPFGDSDPGAHLAVVSTDGRLVREKTRLTNSSLASLAVGPPVNTIEMSYEGRTWQTIGRKLLNTRPLAMQRVAADDSVLGPYAAEDRGLAARHTYASLVQAAFRPAYWDSSELIDGYTAAEQNFSIFFGLAVQAYLSTLISDDSPFDQYIGGKRGTLSKNALDGFMVFEGSAFCMSCHAGPETTSASHTAVNERGRVEPVLTGKLGSLKTQVVDTGFVHTAVRPIAEDTGLDALDDFGAPFSVAARSGAEGLAIAGAFKTPGLRNIEFTGPYFHNGGHATLEQVIDFYIRGGDFPDTRDLPAMMTPMPFSAEDRAQLVEFLKSLTDDRVKFERAPFDHPEICVPVGYAEQPDKDSRFAFSARDRWAGIPAVGKKGNAAPLQTFEELLRGIGADGTRSHTLTDACTIAVP